MKLAVTKSMQPQTFALDVYGTLIDTSGVLVILKKLLGEKAETFSDLWRNKQLEYSFRRGLMNKYVDFSIVTAEALEYCCEAMEVQLEKDQKAALMNQYKSLPAFADAVKGVQHLKAAGHRLFAYSNGSHKAVRGLLEQANILGELDGVVSMEDVRMFKPSPIGYRHFCKTANTKPKDAWMVSGNTFDVIGAAAYGMNTVWVKRDTEAVFDPMGFEVTKAVAQLTELVTVLSSYQSRNK